MDHRISDSSVHGDLQARILEWIAISFSRGSSQPRDWTCVLDGQNNVFPQMWGTLGHYFSFFSLIPSFLVFLLCICECSRWGPPQISKAVYFSFSVLQTGWSILFYRVCRFCFLLTQICPWVFHFRKDVSPEYSLEGLMLKPKLQYFGHLMQRTDSFEKTHSMLGKIEGRRRRGQQRMIVGWHHRLDRHESGKVPGAGDGQRGLACCSPGGHKQSDTTEQLNCLNWIDGNISKLSGVSGKLSTCSEFSSFQSFPIFLLTQPVQTASRTVVSNGVLDH